MKKRNAPFPIYTVEEFQGPAICAHGKSCDPAEHPAHHVRIDLSSEARAVIQAAMDCLQESHLENVQFEYDELKPRAENAGQIWRWHARIEPECSYCAAIRNASALLKFAKE